MSWSLLASFRLALLLLVATATSCIRGGFSSSRDASPDDPPTDRSRNAERRLSDGAIDGPHPDLARVDLRADRGLDGPLPLDLPRDRGVDAPLGPPTCLWAQGYGSTGPDYSSSAAVGPDGTVYVTGPFTNTVTFGTTSLTSQGDFDVYLASFEPDGTLRWAKGFGGSAEDQPELMAVDTSGNVTLVGYVTGAATVETTPLPTHGGRDCFVVSFTPAGALRWAKSFGGTDGDAATGVTVGSQGDLWIAGYFSGTANFGGSDLTSSGGLDLLMLHLDANGNHLWSRGYGGAAKDFGSALGLDGLGNVYVTGGLSGALTMPGGTVLTSQGQTDILFFSIDSTGTVRWATSLGGALDDAPFDLAADASGNVFVTGRFQDSVPIGSQVHTSNGSSDFFLCSFDSGGAYRWSRSFGGSSTDVGRRLALDRHGNLFAAGLFAGSADPGGGVITSAGNSDILLASYASDGAFRWVKPFGGTGSEVGYGLAIDGSDNIVLSGWFSGGAVDFGSGAISPTGDADLFIAYLRP